MNINSQSPRTREEQERNKILMLRISYIPQDGLEPIGEREISLQDVGKKLGLISEAEVLAEEDEVISGGCSKFRVISEHHPYLSY
jgi:hypothetical protein